MSKERYAVTVEEFAADGTLSRKMIESSDKDCDDYCDGEKTLGRLLSFVPKWASAKVGCSGLATIANMCRFVDIDGEAKHIFGTIGDAYDRWDAERDFADCVEVRTNELALNAGDRVDTDGYREAWVAEILAGRSVLSVALDVHETHCGSLDRGNASQSQDLRALRRVVDTWKNNGISEFDDAVLQLLKIAIAEASEKRLPRTTQS